MPGEEGPRGPYGLDGCDGMDGAMGIPGRPGGQGPRGMYLTILVNLKKKHRISVKAYFLKKILTGNFLSLKEQSIPTSAINNYYCLTTD